jgi:hypothetical protein
MKSIIKFPLPYASLSSIYFGITGKPYDWYYVYPDTEWLSYEKSSFDFGKGCRWDITQTSVLSPNVDYQTYKLFLRLRLCMKNTDKPFSVKPVEYVEDMSIEHIVKDAYHFSIYSKKDGSVLLKKKKKWLNCKDIQHICL